LTKKKVTMNVANLEGSSVTRPEDSRYRSPQETRGQGRPSQILLWTRSSPAGGFRNKTFLQRREQTFGEHKNMRGCIKHLGITYITAGG